MKIITFLTLTLTASSAFAVPATPIVTLLNGKTVLGCYSEINTKNNHEITIVIRNAGQLDSVLFGGFRDHGKILVVTGVKRPTEMGIDSSRLNMDGTNALCGYESEDWTYPAPNGTVFTSRGNYKGFFLQNGSNSNTLAEAVLVNGAMNNSVKQLTCTDDESIVNNLLSTILEFNPFKH